MSPASSSSPRALLAGSAWPECTWSLRSRLETGECAEPWFRPFLVPFKLLLLLQYGSRQMCLSEAELPGLVSSFLCYLPKWKVENLPDQTGKEIRDERSIVPYMPRCYIFIILCASVLPASPRSLQPACVVKYGLPTRMHFFFIYFFSYVNIRVLI